MVAKTINLTFDGYWREANKEYIPKVSGVYATYVCTLNEDKTVTLHKLLYIGEAEDVNDRIANHNKWDEWRKYVSKGQELCFACAEVASPDRERAECALIFYHQPVCCTQCMDSFDYDETTVVSDCTKRMGGRAIIKSPITVKRTVKQ